MNWLTARIHAEDDWLTTVAVHPGLVSTDLGSIGTRGVAREDGLEFMKLANLEKMMISVDECCDGLFKVISECARDTHGGKLISHIGEVVDW